MSQVSTTLEWTIPEEVRSCAKAEGVAAYLQPILEVTERIFPMTRRRDVLVTEDPEIADDRHIVIEVDVELSNEEALAARRQWHEATSACCPTALICVFRLSMDLVE